MSEKVKVVHLEMNVCYACNLKCEYCTHLGRYMKGHVPVEDLIHWYESWNTKIAPFKVRIMGGEPLLHPDLETVIRETRRHWRESEVELITNGLLLPKISPDIFSAILDHQIHVKISKHYDDQHFNGILNQGIERLREHGIEPLVVFGDSWWMKSYRLQENGEPVPYRSDPQKAWDTCCVKNMCTTLIDNRLYRCPQLGCFSHARKMGYVRSSAWDVVLDYQPLSPDCTQEELETFMNQGACDHCCICPEQFEQADMYQKLNPFGLSPVRNFFCP